MDKSKLKHDLEDLHTRRSDEWLHIRRKWQAENYYDNERGATPRELAERKVRRRNETLDFFRQGNQQRQQLREWHRNQAQVRSEEVLKRIRIERERDEIDRFERIQRMVVVAAREAGLFDGFYSNKAFLHWLRKLASLSCCNPK